MGVGSLQTQGFQVEKAFFPSFYLTLEKHLTNWEFFLSNLDYYSFLPWVRSFRGEVRQGKVLVVLFFAVMSFIYLSLSLSFNFFSSFQF